MRRKSEPSLRYPLRAAAAALLLACAACKSSPKTLDTGSCGYALALSSTTFTAPGASATATVTPTAGNSTACGWTLTSDASWLVIAAGTTGSGQATAAFTVTGNFATLSRTGNIVLSWSGPTTGSKSVGVTQTGVSSAGLRARDRGVVLAVTSRLRATRPDGRRRGL